MRNLRNQKAGKLRWALCLLACIVTTFATSLLPGAPLAAVGKPQPPKASATPIAQPPAHHNPPSTIGKVKAKGAFTADFGLPGSLPLEQVAPLIERDRMYMSARRGMQNKYLPLRIDFATGNLLSGGRYLFDTEHDARRYKHWVENDFILDGTHFFDRPIFLNPDYHAWEVIGAHHLGEIQTRIIVRTERWSVPRHNQTQRLKQKWDEILEEAAARSMTSVWLLYNREERLAQLVYFTDRVAPPDPTTPDFASLAALETAPPLGHHFDAYNWTKTFDRTQWVLTIWFPFATGDTGLPSLWPHSPPFPAPSCNDGVCEVSRGESNATCPGDCPPLAGNGVCDAGENSMNCPGDCPPQ